MAKQEIKQEQVLNVEEAVSRSEAFINKNKKVLVAVVAAVVAIVTVGLLVSTYVIAPREKKAAEALFAGERYFQNGDYELALDGDQYEYAGFEAVAADFKGTKAANLAKAYEGISLAKLGRYEEAIAALQATTEKADAMLSRATT